MSTPRHPDEISPAWLTFALRQGGALGEAAVVGATVEVIGQGVGFLSSVARVTLVYDRDEPGAPHTVVVKLEPDAGSFRDIGSELHAFEREIRFYQEVAPNVPIRLARLFYAATEPPDYAIVMEDLSFATPGDQVAGMHTDQVLAAARTMGRLQGSYWNNAALRRLAWMPESNSLEVDYLEKWPSFVEHFGHLADPAALAVGERLRHSIGWLTDQIAGRPRTIVHSDLRADNLLFGPSDSREAVLIVDWQLAVRSMGTYDVARLMGGSEPKEERSGHQVEVLRAWYDEVVAADVSDYPWADAVRDYRLGSLSHLCVCVHFHTAVIDATGRTRDLIEAMYRRGTHFALEIDAASVLP